MIGPKPVRPTPAQERTAYRLATARDKDTCVRCGARPITRDHRKARSLGGPTTIENLQCLCGHGTTGCHGWKEHNPTKATWDGFSVPGWADPGSFPARRLIDGRLEWVMYVPDVAWFDYPTGFRLLDEIDARLLMEGAA